MAVENPDVYRAVLYVVLFVVAYFVFLAIVTSVFFGGYDSTYCSIVRGLGFDVARCVLPVIPSRSVDVVKKIGVLARYALVPTGVVVTAILVALSHIKELVQFVGPQ